MYHSLSLFRVVSSAPKARSLALIFADTTETRKMFDGVNHLTHTRALRLYLRGGRCKDRRNISAIRLQRES
jgi:hypothetical protein